MTEPTAPTDNPRPRPWEDHECWTHILQDVRKAYDQLVVADPRARHDWYHLAPDQRVRIAAGPDWIRDGEEILERYHDTPNVMRIDLRHADNDLFTLQVWEASDGHTITLVNVEVGLHRFPPRRQASSYERMRRL
jgi:hypothetical protein